MIWIIKICWSNYEASGEEIIPFEWIGTEEELQYHILELYEDAKNQKNDCFLLGTEEVSIYDLKCIETDYYIQPTVYTLEEWLHSCGVEFSNFYKKK